MADVRGVLVVPAKGDPGGLLAGGACNALPPLAVDLGGPYWTDVGMVEDRDIDGADYALPLWWDGALVPGGWDRARRVQATAEEREGDARWRRLMVHGHEGRDLLYGARDPKDWGSAALASGELVSNGSASRVVLVDADGREVLLG